MVTKIHFEHIFKTFSYRKLVSKSKFRLQRLNTKKLIPDLKLIELVLNYSE